MKLKLNTYQYNIDMYIKFRQKVISRALVIALEAFEIVILSHN